MDVFQAIQADEAIVRCCQIATLQVLQMTSAHRYLYASGRSLVQLSLSTNPNAAAMLALQWAQWGLSRVQIPAMH